MKTPGGMTLLEVLIFSALMSIALLCLAPFLTKTVQVQRIINSATIPAGSRAGDGQAGQ